MLYWTYSAEPYFKSISQNEHAIYILLQDRNKFVYSDNHNDIFDKMSDTDHYD
jgi:hypothetical protein